MNRVASVAAGTTGTRCTCTACPLLCDDILLSEAGAEHACETGREAFAAAVAESSGPPAGQAPDSPPVEAWHDGGPVSRDAAVGMAAATLVAGRRALLTGLAGATVETVVAACDLAELVGAAVDPGAADLAAAAGPTLARAGRVSADWEEVRDRADLVIFWDCDPAASHPRFVERFVRPWPGGGRPRRTVAVGAAAVMPAGPGHLHLPIGRDRAVEAARCLQLLLAGGEPPGTVDASLAAACRALADAIHGASCVAFVTSGSDAVGLPAWSVVHLVRAIAHRTPAFEVSLADAGGGLAAAATVCTWRYGAAGAIAAADRSGARFLPGEAVAARLIARGEVDVVLAVAPLAAEVEEAIAAAGPRLAIVRIAATARAPLPAGRTTWLRSAAPPLTAGTLLRGDGRVIAVVPPWPSLLPAPRDLIRRVHDAVAVLRSAAPGGRA